MPINKAFQRAINQTTTFIISNCLIKFLSEKNKVRYRINVMILFRGTLGTSSL